MEKILIFGISGQDGSYLAEQLLAQEMFQVHGVIRRADNPNLKKAQKSKNLSLHLGNITDSVFVKNIIFKLRPTKIFNLAAQSFVKASFDMPEHTKRTNQDGVRFIIESIIELKIKQNFKIKFFQASTSQMFGQKDKGTLLNENSVMLGVSPYGIAKLNAHKLCLQNRINHQIFVSTAISFNHQSVRRPSIFVTRKVTKHVAKYSLNNEIPPLQIGNLNAIRDWGHAKDYIKGFIKIMNLQQPNDYILSTGKCYSVRQLIQITFNFISIKIKWSGIDQEEIGYNEKDILKKVLVKVSSQHFRQKEVPFLQGDSSKMTLATGWTSKIHFQELIRQMFNSDLKQQNMDNI